MCGLQDLASSPMRSVWGSISNVCYVFLLRRSELGPQTATRSRVTRVARFVVSWELSCGLSVGSISSIANNIPDRSNIAGLQSGVVLVMFAPAEG